MVKLKPQKAWEQIPLDFDAPIALPTYVRYDNMASGYKLYMGLDPGGGCGLAILGYNNETGDCRRIGTGTYTERDLMVMLRHNLTGIIEVGVEEYVTYTASQGANTGANTTSEIIGKVQEVCQHKSVPCFLQPASIKKAAWAWAQNRWPTLDMSYNTQHEKDAITHALWRIRHRIYDNKG